MKYQVKRTGKRLPINTTYQQTQLAKREKEIAETVIKEKHNVPERILTPKQHPYETRERIDYILRMNNIEPNEAVVTSMLERFQYTALCDIKNHEVIKEYYKVEDLHKYLTNV